MGSSFVRTPPKPVGERQAKSTRGHHAEAVVDALLPLVQEVFTDARYAGRERECYEVSQALRDKFEYVYPRVQNIIPNSALRLPSRDPKASVLATRGMVLSRKIIMVFVNYVDHHIVRPGPDPEDRIASDCWDETLAIRDELVALVRRVIAVDDNERGLTGEAK